MEPKSEANIIRNFKMVELINTYNLGKKMLPNSICLTPDGLVGCGAKNKIFRLDPLGGIEILFGSDGFGRKKFRQPVVVTFFNGLLFVLDWHNHRIVIYESCKKYVGEIGKLRVYGSSPIRTRLLRIKNIMASHKYNLNHFSLPLRIDRQPDNYFKKINRIFYYFLGRKALCKYAPFHKPNGIAISKNQMVVTQKDRRSIQFYSITNTDGRPRFSLKREINEIYNKRLGRLGNCVQKSQRVFICDETSHSVLIFSLNGHFIDKVELQKNVPVFCCCVLSSEHLLVGGESAINLVNLKTRKTTLIISDFGEIHSMIYDNDSQKIFVADRLDGTIREYKISFSKFD